MAAARNTTGKRGLGKVRRLVRKRWKHETDGWYLQLTDPEAYAAQGHTDDPIDTSAPVLQFRSEPRERDE